MEDVRGIFTDLGIDYSDMQTNPREFALRVVTAAKKLENQLSAKNALVDVVERFKNEAQHDTDAAAIAEDFIRRMEDEIYNFTPEVMVHILARIPALTQDMHGIVRTTAMRKGNLFSRRRIHAMYVTLRKVYESHVAFFKAFQPEEMGNVPMIPAKPGNYSDDSSIGITEYVFYVGKTSYYNFYEVARIIGIEIQSYQDLVDHFKAHKTFNGQPLRLVELSR